MKRKIHIILLILIPFVFAFSYQVWAQGIKERMKARLPVLKALKKEGAIGENNLGYLEFIGSKKKKEDVVQAENADRKRVYSAIAKKQGTTETLVGKRRAAKLFQNAKPGEWVKDAKGKWVQKK